MSDPFDWNAAAQEVRDMCESSGWAVNQTQAELAVAALCDRFVSDAERTLIQVAKAWVHDWRLNTVDDDRRLIAAVEAVRAVDSRSPDGGVADDGTTTDGGPL